MSYQVLARKYRPQKFSEVIGQDHVTRTLKNAIEQKRIAHGYIFSGHRGIGKTTIALATVDWAHERQCFPGGIFELPCERLTSDQMLLTDLLARETYMQLSTEGPAKYYSESSMHNELAVIDVTWPSCRFCRLTCACKSSCGRTIPW